MEIKRRGPSKDGPPAAPAGPAPKHLLLESIRNKIRQGYYGTDGVEEDLSDKLARLFDP